MDVWNSLDPEELPWSMAYYQGSALFVNEKNHEGQNNNYEI